MKKFKDLKVGDDVYRLDKDYALVILKVSNINKYEGGSMGLVYVTEDKTDLVEIVLPVPYVNCTEYYCFVNGEYWFYSDPIACSRALSGHIQYLSNMIVNFTDIKDQLISGRV